MEITYHAGTELSLNLFQFEGKRTPAQLPQRDVLHRLEPTVGFKATQVFDLWHAIF